MKQLTQDFADAAPCNWTKLQVQTFAAEVAQNLGYTRGGDLTQIVENLGGRIKVADWETVGDTGSISVLGEGDFTIWLSPLSGKTRDRFTIAHELGHYFLHSKLGEKRITVRRDGSDRVEWEANWFAAGFLMPEEEFRAKLKEWNSHARLAAYFDVSEAAIAVRRRALQL
jgi:hypothetical protein